MEKEFYKRFPYYKKLILDKKGSHIVLKFLTRYGEKLSADGVSDGVILSLAFLALAHNPTPPNILLVEEPENGVHHASLKDIVGTLKKLTEEKGVQVILTTHSPYLLDLVEPEEVRVFTKDDEGAVHAKKMSEAPEVEDMKKHFMTGEIWSCLSEEGLVGKAGGKSE